VNGAGNKVRCTRSGLILSLTKPSSLLPIKGNPSSLHSSGENAEEEHSQQWDANIAALEDLLATKLSEFLGSSYSYTLHQIPSSMKAHLYKGPPSGIRR